jgi:hypothetical protein
LAGSSDKKQGKNEVEGKDNYQPIFPDTRANLLNDRFAKLSDDEFENPGDDGSDVHECESVLGDDSGGEDCEYLYAHSNWGRRGARKPEYVSLQEYDARGQYGFYAPMNEASSDDDDHFEDYENDWDTDENSIISGDSCADEHELADLEVEDTILDFDPGLVNRDVRVLADAVAPELRHRAPGPAARKLVRLYLQEARIHAVLMALHPRLGRDSPLRLLEPGIVVAIARLTRAVPAACSPVLADFDAFRLETQEEQEEAEEEMNATLDATSESEFNSELEGEEEDEDDDEDEDAEEEMDEEEGERDEEGEGGNEDDGVGDRGSPCRPVTRTILRIIASAAAGATGSLLSAAESAGSVGGPAAAASIHDGGGCGGGFGGDGGEVERAVRAAALDNEAVEALVAAGKGYLQDLKSLAREVRAGPHIREHSQSIIRASFEHFVESTIQLLL